MDKQYYKRIRRTWTRPQSGKTHRFTQNDTEKIQLEKGPKERKCSKQLQTDNLPTKNMEIITAQIREETYYWLTSRGLFAEEKKGCCKGSRGTAELHYIDQHILNERKTRRKNLALAWIDNKKAYDIVPQTWIINCLKMYKISHEVMNFIEKSMKI